MHVMEKRLLNEIKEGKQGASASDSNKNQGDTSDDPSNLKIQPDTGGTSGSSDDKVQGSTSVGSTDKLQTEIAMEPMAESMTEMEPMTAIQADTSMTEPTVEPMAVPMTEIQVDTSMTEPTTEPMAEPMTEIQKAEESDDGSSDSETQKGAGE